MSKRLLSIASGVLIAILAFSNAFAGNIKLSSVTFSLGSLISNGTVTGLGNTDYTLVLNATGIPAIVCTNNGGNQVPGQSFPKVSAQGTTQVGPGHLGYVIKNGSSPYHVETGQVTTPLTWQTAGCPNANWSWQITFVYWTDAVITAYLASDTNFTTPIITQHYVCTTTLTSVSCTPTK